MTDLDDALDSIRRLAVRLDGRFPRPNNDDPLGRYTPVTLSGQKPWSWVDAFWPAQLALANRLTGDGFFRDAHDALLPQLDTIFDAPKKISHDIGFFGQLVDDQGFKRRCVEALVDLYDGHMIPSWPDNNTRIIADSAATTPLLFSPDYAAIYEQHFAKLEQLIRPDGSTYHVGYFVDGTLTHGTTHQGLNAESCWSRGQAWMIHGFNQLATYTGRDDVVTKLLGFPALGSVPPFDYAAESGPRDTSAAAILLDALLTMPEYPATARNLSRSLLSFSVASNELADGLLAGGTQGLQNIHPYGQQLPYGDYYYLSALAREPMKDDHRDSL